MSVIRYTTPTEAYQIWCTMPEPRSARKLAKAAGIDRERASRMIKQDFPAIEAGEIPVSPTTPEVTPEVTPEDGDKVVTGKQQLRPPTIEAIIATHQIDLSQWKVKQWRAWTALMEGAVWYLYHVTFAPVADERSKAVLAWFANRLAALPVKQFPTVAIAPSPVERDFMLEISVPDAHIGKYCWGPETGMQWGRDDACKAVINAYAELYAMVPPSLLAQVVIPLGNDLFHTDTIVNTTTHGTHQDDDGVWQETFLAGLDTSIQVIENLAATCPNVKVLTVPGNHDWQKVFYLSVCLAKHFAAHPNVEIDWQPTARKYHTFGSNLIGYTHGKHEKIGDLAGGLMAAECREIWSSVKHCEWHIGHEHTQGQREKHGVIVRKLPSLSPADSWHMTNGYVGNRRAALAFLYHRTRGWRAAYNYELS